MTAIWRVLKTLSRLQIVALAIVLFGAAAATYGGYLRANSEEQVALEEDQQLIPVRLGDLINEVTTSGTIAFPNREMLRFGSPGIVAELLAEEGEVVSQGQALVKLDATAVASLVQALAQAKVDHADAVESLEELREIDPLAAAQAREAVADAEFQLQEAVEALADAHQPYTPEEIETQRKLVADTDFALLNAEQDLDATARRHAVLLGEARKAHAEAQSALQEARQALTDFAPSYFLSLDEARQAVADAELALDAALTAVADFSPDYVNQLLQARQSEADAELALEEAGDSLSIFASDRAQQLAQARQNKADLELGLQEAKEALEDFSPGHDKDLAAARQEKADAEIALGNAQQALERFENSKGSWLSRFLKDKEDLDAQLAELQDRLDTLLLSQQGGMFGLDTAIDSIKFGIAATEESLEVLQESLAARDQLAAVEALAQSRLDEAKTDLARLEGEQDSLTRMQLDTSLALVQSDLRKASEELTELEKGGGVLQHQQLEAAVDLAQETHARAKYSLEELESGPNSLELRQLEASVDLARGKLREAKLARAALESPADPELVKRWEDKVKKAETGLADKDAQAAVDAAKQVLDAIMSSADGKELQLVESDIALAQVTLIDTQQELANLEMGPDPREIRAKEAEIVRLRAALAQAKEDLEGMLAGPDALALALLDAQAVSAQAALAKAEEDLQETLAGPDPVEVDLARADVASAAQKMKEAAKTLTDAVLRAPTDGFVSLVNIEEGDEVQARAPILEVVDPSVVEVDGIVDEIDVLSIRQGAGVEVTLDALPGEVIPGTVVSVSPGATNQQGVVTYPIGIRMEVPPSLQVREGLTAVASIVLRQERNVLLLPQQALVGTFDSPMVRVLSANGVVEAKPVTLGNSDDFWVSVKQGLQEGDQVVMESAEVGTSRFSFGQFRRVTGGRSGGGGRPGGARGGR